MKSTIEAALLAVFNLHDGDGPETKAQAADELAAAIADAINPRLAAAELTINDHETRITTLESE